MLAVPFVILSVAVLLGTTLAALHLRATEGGARPPSALGLAHGLIGSAGTGGLIWTLLAGDRPIGAFGWDAIALLVAALVAGIAIPLLARARRGGVEATMALHGSIAIIGYVILMAYVSVG